ncbi:hypothetical protein SRHO_G00302070 [Serrasalmus rhombeus]
MQVIQSVCSDSPQPIRQRFPANVFPAYTGLVFALGSCSRFVSSRAEQQRWCRTGDRPASATLGTRLSVLGWSGQL